MQHVQRRRGAEVEQAALRATHFPVQKVFPDPVPDVFSTTCSTHVTSQPQLQPRAVLPSASRAGLQPLARRRQLALLLVERLVAQREHGLPSGVTLRAHRRHLSPDIKKDGDG